MTAPQIPHCLRNSHQLALDLQPPRPECRICGEPFPDRAPSTGSHWECEVEAEPEYGEPR